MLKQINKGLTSSVKKMLNLKSSSIWSAQKFYFSGGHSSGSDHDHHHTSTTSTDASEPEDHVNIRRSKLFKKEEFSVDNLLDSLKTPLSENKQYVPLSSLQNFNDQNEYVNFLATNFEKHALRRFPEYKTHLSEFKHRIHNYDNLNSYQREVLTLEMYHNWRLEKLRQETVDAFNSSGSALDQLRNRFNMISKITKTEVTHDHGNHGHGHGHGHGDRFLDTLKQKLQDVVRTELEFEEFRNSYNKEIESQVLAKVVEKKNVYFDINVNKLEGNRRLHNLKSPLNPKKPIYDATIDEHFNPQHWLSDPHQAKYDRWKYMAYFDLILDNHMRQVRPNGVYDDIFTYVKPHHRPLYWSENDFNNNMYFEYRFSYKHEVFRAWQRDNKLLWEGNFSELGKPIPEELPHHGHDHHAAHHEDHHHEEHHDSHHPTYYQNDEGDLEPENPERPTGKLWKDKHKFPHVADRLAWEGLMEHPMDKNPFIENVVSHPTYQWQPFVQTPPINAHEDLDFEFGETVYENKFVNDWILFWKIVLLMVPLPVIVYIYESYNQQTSPTPEYTARFTMVHPHNMGHRGMDRPLMEKVKFWGKDMWMWQHWIRKSLWYIVATFTVFFLHDAFKKTGNHYVSKMVYNRSKDLCFVWKSSYLRQRMRVYELHYLEQNCPSIVNSWGDLGQNNKDGLFVVTDLRTGGDKLVFYNEKKYN